ncbi:hypothetical protein SK3146_00742 [Paenibacillus konkukensis]|uniref:Uncharacterized protein n=1 Tax=Paenibacillus konkukensis TaxID=2020716 RepID=A0ABY4RGL3_9BACL|nr:hypothetical protein [Paenibacillus konkukensis]UQZ81586.1 hypothetical protein SK3146_00742 [Paenibacillus konkukensis]
MRRSAINKMALLVLLASSSVWGLPDSKAMAESFGYQRDELDAAARLSSVALSPYSGIELKNAAVMPGDNGNMLYFTLTVTNGGNGSLSFLDYWVKVYSRSGAEFTADLLPQDKLKKEIPAGQQMDFSFYAPVNDATVLSDLSFSIIRWDYSSAELEKKVGDIRFPEEAEAAGVFAPESASKTVSMGGMPVALEVTAWSALTNDSFISPKLTLRLTNKGQATLKLPGYQYSLRASNGAMYPLDIAVNGDKQQLQPEVPLDLQLKAAQLPAAAADGGWDVVMTQPVTVSNDLKLDVPVTTLKVTAEQQAPQSLGDSIEYTNKDGVYEMKLEKLDRMPWDDQDVLSADLSISHRQAAALPFPELKAYYELDGGVKVEAKAVKTDQAVGLPPAASVHVQLVGKIPYTYPFSAIKLVLQEKESDNGTEDIAQFLLPPSAVKLPEVPFGQPQSITAAGRSTQYAPRAINTFTDGKSKLLEAQLEVTNREKRSGAIPKLSAFVKTPDDSLYPAKVREVKQKLNPQGTALVSFSTKLPVSVDTSGLKLVVGESVTDQHISLPDDKPDAYINAVEMELPRERQQGQETLKQLSFAPYTISLSQISTWLDSSQLRVNFLYDLEKDSFLETNNDGSKVIIQFQDEAGNMTYEQKFYLETAADDDDLKLELGEHSYKMTVKDSDLLGKIQSLKKYKLSVYYEFQGMRKLLGSQTIDWFGKTD